MFKLASATFFAAATLLAQSAETLFFVGDMRGANEVPAVATASYGSAVLFVHVVKDAQGKVISGSVDFNVTGQFADAGSVVGLHIHRGAAGVNGPVTVDSGVNGAGAIAVPAGRTLIQRTGQTKADNVAGLDTLNGMLADPQGFYVNLHTLTNPGGLFRGQLYRAERRSFMTSLSGANEVPALDAAFTGLGTFHGFRAFDSAGRYVTGGGMFIINYALGSAHRLTGLHIHRGAAGVNGPVVIDSTLSNALAIDTAASGAGSISFLAAAPNDLPAAVLALNDMWDAPSGFYLNMHTMVNPGGMIRGQVRAAESVSMSVNMLTSNEVPAITGLDASALAAVQVDVLRNAAGAASHALVAYSVNHRFPGETSFTGLHIHEGAAGVNGPVRVDSAITGATAVVSADGFGNIFRVFNANTEAAMTAVNGLLANPAGYYLNLHTTVHPGGAVRSQLAAPSTAIPSIWDVISGVSDPAIQVLGQGGLMTVFGERLFQIPSSVAAPALPASVNGTTVTVGGRPARLMMLGLTGGLPAQYVVAQVPFDTPAGTADIVVHSGSLSSPPFRRNTIAAAAPALYFDTLGGIALRPDFTLVRPNAPAAAGELIGLVATGLGATTPALEDGQFAPGVPLAPTAQTVTATMGGRAATVVAAFGLPGYAGVYSVAVLVPAGLTAGNAMTQIRAGTAASNNVLIPVR